MMLQATAFALEALAIFTLVGFGLTAWTLDDLGLELLAVPVVGLAITFVAFQLLTPFVPPPVTLLVLVVTLGSLSLWNAWQRRAALLAGIRRHWIEIVVLSAAGLLFYLALLAHVFAAGFFTLAGWPSDNIFSYAPAGEFLRTHAFMPSDPLALVDNLLTRFLARASIAFPNSFGPIDGAMSALTGWPVHALIDPLDAFLYAQVVPTTYLLLIRLKFPRQVAIAAVVLLMANQLVFWVMGNVFQQEMLAMPIFIGSLGLLLSALRSQGRRAAALAGLVAASLLGLYIPIFFLWALCAVGYLAVLLVQAGRQQLKSYLAQLIALAAGGLAGSAATIYWLLPGHGLQFWVEELHAKSAAGGIAFFYPAKYLIGAAPVAALWSPPGLPVLWWGPSWVGVSRVIAALLAILIVAGVASVALRRALPELALFAAIALYLVYLRFVAAYPYGFMKTLSFVVPLTSALLAAGALDLLPPVVRRTGYGRHGTAVASRNGTVSAVGIVTFAIVFLAQAFNAIEMQHMWVRAGPAFPRSYQALSALRTLVPPGAGILQVNPSPAYHDGIKFAAARYFLTDHNLALSDAEPPEQAPPFRYDYVIAPWPPATDRPSGFRKLWSQDDIGLALYQRLP
jgi:hypothetical protein